MSIGEKVCALAAKNRQVRSLSRRSTENLLFSFFCWLIPSRFERFFTFLTDDGRRHSRTREFQLTKLYKFILYLFHVRPTTIVC